MKIYLASKSPRRREVLENLCLDFEVVESNYKENNNEKISPLELAKKHAIGKARGVSKKIDNGLILAADTFVVLNEEIIGKPKSSADAKKILLKLSEKTHQVISAICLIDTKTKKELTDTVISEVSFIKISENSLNKYLKIANYMDKAGAYAFQEHAVIFVEKINGSITNVLGLPVKKMLEMIKKIFNQKIFN